MPKAIEPAGVPGVPKTAWPMSYYFVIAVALIAGLGERTYLTTLAALAAVVIAMVSSRSLAWTLLLGLSFIAGGGFGNLADRLFRGGRVSDFLNLGIGTLRTGIFNCADMAILAGCVLLLVSPSTPRRAPWTRN